MMYKIKTFGNEFAILEIESNLFFVYLLYNNFLIDMPYSKIKGNI